MLQIWHLGHLLEAQTVYQRAFGREARAVAEPAVAEAFEVEHAFNELADAWRNQADSFLVEHPAAAATAACRASTPPPEPSVPGTEPPPS